MINSLFPPVPEVRCCRHHTLMSVRQLFSTISQPGPFLVIVSEHQLGPGSGGSGGGGGPRL